MGSDYRLVPRPSAAFNKDESRADFTTNSEMRLASAQMHRKRLLRKTAFTPLKKYMLSRRQQPYAMGVSATYIVSKQITDMGSVPDSLMQFYHPIEEQVKERRRYMLNQDKLVETRVLYTEKRADLNLQWQQLYRDEIQLKKSFLRFNQFVKENLIKRERAAKKVGEDIILKNKRIVEVEKVKVNLQIVHRGLKNLDKVVRQHRVFEDYLSTVARSDMARGYFRTVDDILNKYETLVEARKELTTEQERMLTELEAVKQKLVKLADESRLEMLGLINRKCDLTLRYNATLSVARQQEIFVEKVKQSSMEAFQQIAETKFAIHNLYCIMCNRTNCEPQIDPSDYEGLLVFIRRSFQETLQAKKLLKRNIPSHHTLVYRA